MEHQTIHVTLNNPPYMRCDNDPQWSNKLGCLKQCGECFRYALGKCEPNYPMPAIPMLIEYIFQGFGIDGIFVRVDGYIVAGAYRDGMPCKFDYPT